MSGLDLRVIGQLFLKAATMKRKRALLTVAAIAWGTVAIVMLLSFGEGLKLQMMRGRRGMGENLAVWWPGETSKVWQGLPTGRAIRPHMDDLAYLRRRMPDVGVIGEMTGWSTSLTWGPKAITARVTGTNWEYGELRNHYAQPGGRFLDPRDEADKRRVIFFGNELAEELFGSADPVGQTVGVAGTPYLVIGVMQPKLQMGTYGGPDASHAVVPITTFAAQLGRQRVNNIVLKVARPELMQSALDRFAESLSARYRFDPTDEQVMGVWNTAENAETLGKVMLGLQIFLGIIGTLTLLIGGIGVANIMYAVVKESTREIGVQMALGARRRWITGPYVLQGLAYTLLGGTSGMVLSFIFIILLSFVPTEGNRALEFLGKPTLSWQIAIATAASLGTIGMLAGYLPARRAAAVDPAETLRCE